MAQRVEGLPLGHRQVGGLGRGCVLRAALGAPAQLAGASSGPALVDCLLLGSRSGYIVAESSANVALCEGNQRRTLFHPCSTTSHSITIREKTISKG